MQKAMKKCSGILIQMEGFTDPHVLVLGESGFGKPYTIACLLAELAQRRLLSVVLDYG